MAGAVFLSLETISQVTLKLGFVRTGAVFAIDFEPSEPKAPEWFGKWPRNVGLSAGEEPQNLPEGRQNGQRLGRNTCIDVTPVPNPKQLLFQITSSSHNIIIT